MDDKCVTTSRIGRLWLMASYIYYHRPDLKNFISDEEFDELTHVLVANHEYLEDTTSNGSLKQLITKDRLKAGSAFDLEEKGYHMITKHTAASITTDKDWDLQEYLGSGYLVLLGKLYKK